MLEQDVSPRPSLESPRPSLEPPAGATMELLWRLAARLHHDHQDDPAAGRCRVCSQPWPCSGRRLAELGLTRAAL